VPNRGNIWGQILAIPGLQQATTMLMMVLTMMMKPMMAIIKLMVPATKATAGAVAQALGTASTTDVQR